MCTKAINEHIIDVENNLIHDARIGKFYSYLNEKLNGSLMALQP